MAQKTQTAMQMTAIQQAIELIKVQQSLYEIGSHTWYAYQYSIDLIAALLPVEREQIVDAVIYGDADTPVHVAEVRANNYYNDIYQKA